MALSLASQLTRSTPLDLALLRWYAGCLVPLDIVELEDVVELARVHCKMKLGRLELLRTEYQDHWYHAMRHIERNRQKRRQGITIRRKPRIRRDQPERFMANLKRREGLAGVIAELSRKLSKGY